MSRLNMFVAGWCFMGALALSSAVGEDAILLIILNIALGVLNFILGLRDN